jgi:hypothetical protein
MPAPLAKNHHYVPQFLLRGFAFDEKEKVFVFDKLTSKTFPSAIRNVASENGFYNFDGGSAETDLARLETDCSIIVNRIRSEASVDWVSDRDRNLLSVFTAVQILRVKSARQMLADLHDSIGKRIVAADGDHTIVNGFKLRSPEELKHMSIQNLALAKEIAPNIRRKKLILVQAPTGTDFLIGDNPVTIACNVPRPNGIGIGVSTFGVEIYLPISSSLVLQFLCENLAMKFLTGFEHAKSLGLSQVPSNISSIAASIKQAKLQFSNENVVYLNSHQVYDAARFIFRSRNDFNEVLAMINDDPELRNSKPYAIQ